jgi:hypothetical protein
MLSKLLGWSAVVVGLLLAGVQKGSADQLFYCKNPAITNQPLVLYTATPTCPPGTTVTSITTGGTPAQPVGTNLLFPLVQAFPQSQNTEVAISNTSADPFNTATQSGTCTFTVFGAGVTPVATFTSPTIQPGTTFHLSVGGIIPSGTNVTGYMFVSCNFSYAHGLAFLENIGISPPTSQNYLAVIVQMPRPNGENLNN